MPLVIIFLVLFTNYVIAADLSAASRSFYLITLGIFIAIYFLSVYFL